MGRYSTLLFFFNASFFCSYLEKSASQKKTKCILLSLIKEEHSDTGYSTDDPDDIMLSEISQPQNDKYGTIPLT